MQSLTTEIIEYGKQLGFDLIDVAPAVELPNAPKLLDYLSHGRHGEMGWMAQHIDLRIDPRKLFDQAKSVISVGMVYRHAERQPLVAAYAQGEDYHYLIRDKLKALEKFIRLNTTAEVVARRAVDSKPLLERDVALLAGLGWLGKNTCVINQKLGSFMLLGELLINLELDANTTPAPDRCGTCRRCLDACPTDAFVGPYEMDARRCISYLTIESREAIPHEFRTAIGENLFGCDICQDVCPWNRKAPTSPHDAFAPSDEVLNLDLHTLLFITETEFRAQFKRSPIFRAHRDGLVRNVAVVLGNRADPESVPHLERVLREESSELVLVHVLWALGQIGNAEARCVLDAYVPASEVLAIERSRAKHVAEANSA